MRTKNTAPAVSRGAKIRSKKRPTTPASSATPAKAKKAPPPAQEGKAPSTSKQDKLIELLSRPEGATIADLTGATGWQAHSIRGAMSGALKKKLKLTIVTEKVDGKDRIYRIAKEKSA